MENNEMSDINGTYAWTSQHSGFTQRWVPHSLVKPVMVSHLLPRAAIWLQECWSFEGRLVLGLARLPWNILKTGPCSCWFPQAAHPAAVVGNFAFWIGQPQRACGPTYKIQIWPENQLQTFAPVAAKKEAAEKRESEVQKFTAEPFQEEPHHGSMDRHLWIIPTSSVPFCPNGLDAHPQHRPFSDTPNYHIVSYSHPTNP